MLQLDLHLDVSSVWRLSIRDHVFTKSSGSGFFRIRFLQDSLASGSGFFKIPRLQDPVSSGFCANTFFRKSFVYFNVPQHFEGSTFVVKHLIRDYLLCILNKHISPIAVLSSNSKTSRGRHLMHLQSVWHTWRSMRTTLPMLLPW